MLRVEIDYSSSRVYIYIYMYVNTIMKTMMKNYKNTFIKMIDLIK